MSQIATFENLDSRLNRIDVEISALRRELRQLPQANPIADRHKSDTSWEWADKEALHGQMQAIFDSLGIEGNPIGALALQKQMTQASLARNEVSQSLIAVRGES